MIRLQVICPADLTPQVLTLLTADPGTAHVSVSKANAVQPQGDTVQADIARAAANDVLDGLTALGLSQSGAITFGSVDYQLSEAAQRAEDAVSGRVGEAVVWQEALQRAWRDGHLTPVFLTLLTIALLLAVIGVATGSPVTIVGAMVVGPEYGPLAAISVGLVRRERAQIRRGALALAVGFPVAMVVTAVATLLWVRLGWIDVEGVENARSFDFIYDVGPFSFVVALLAGAAGMLAQVTARSAALVGVFISVTTVPAAGLAVAAALAGAWPVAGSSLLQLAVNLLGIVVAGIVVLSLRPGSGRELGPARRFRNWLSAARPPR
ncbi:DUF389 domain-containing protein [Nocardia huaxiensis]|uniref:DUF389 domain-containing protein n=1 Tax=Nocardia huaxiensis TaxID=2755382 RepID=A0A7D6ZJM1_9NOCA|nr:DUF389 domain-containing protein [Nocardia huaxiensis]QLY32659.1 DUF389 domain-containing protein [Nocardia huaxiensis]